MVELEAAKLLRLRNQMDAQFILYLLAAMAFLLGAVDLPRFGAVRCIAVGLGLIALSLVVR